MPWPIYQNSLNMRGVGEKKQKIPWLGFEHPQGECHEGTKPWKPIPTTRFQEASELQNNLSR